MQRDILVQILPVLTVTVFAMGTIVGSFLNVVVWRLPRGESLVHPGSHCPKCNHAIRPWENIPIVSWLLLRARCSNCHEPISVRYPLVEFATGLLYLPLWWRLWTGDLPLALSWGYFFLGSALLAATLIDLEHMIVPDRITLTGMGVALVLALMWPEARLQQDLSGTPEGSHLILDWAVDATSAWAGAWWRLSRAKALADIVLGAAFGYGMLWLLLEAGKRLWGRLNIDFSPPAEAILSAEGLRLGDQLQETWEDLLFRKTDRFTGQAQHVALELNTQEPPVTAEYTRIAADTSGLSVGSKHWQWQEVKCLRTRLASCVLPREVMGHGDLKLLAMVGAFLGADATIFILMLAAASGCILGTAHIVLHRHHRQTPIPFGPFIAAATLLWILAGNSLLHWYVRRFV